MSNYQATGISIIYPSGTILSFLGTSDPPGWLICDGISRTATITNEFATLATILNNSLSPTTQNTSSSVTPPNLQGLFLQGRYVVGLNEISPEAKVKNSVLQVSAGFLF